MEKQIINKDYFDKLYADSTDPWNFSASPYEQEKYLHTIKALGGRNYENGLELGCSIGILTEMLGKQCKKMLGVDISEAPIKQAAERLRNQPHLYFSALRIPDQYPDDQYDLIVVSEVGYYLSREELSLTRELIFDSLVLGGSLCLVHWRPQIEGCLFTGDDVNHFLIGGGSCELTYESVNDKYRIDVLQKC